MTETYSRAATEAASVLVVRASLALIATAKELLDSGAITQEEFEALKAKALM